MTDEGEGCVGGPLWRRVSDRARRPGSDRGGRVGGWVGERVSVRGCQGEDERESVWVVKRMSVIGREGGGLAGVRERKRW